MVCIQIFGSQKRARKWFPATKMWAQKMGPFLEPLIRATIRILLAGSKNGSPRFWSHFFTLFGMHFIAFLHKTSEKTSKTQFLSCQQAKGSLNMLHTWSQRQPPHCVDYEAPPTLGKKSRRVAEGPSGSKLWTLSAPLVNASTGQSGTSLSFSAWTKAGRECNPTPKLRQSLLL